MIRVVSFLATLAILLVACGSSQPAAAPASTSAPATAGSAAVKPPASVKPAASAAGKAPVKLVQALPAVNFGTILPGFVGNDQGYFRDEGIQIDTPTMAPPAAIAGVVSGQVDFAVAGSGVRAAMQGAPLKSVFYYFNTTLFEVVSRPEIKSVTDLKGKKIGQTAPNSNDGLTSAAVVKTAGLDPAKDVSFVTAPGGGELAALSAGAVDAMSVTPEVGASAAKQGMTVLVSVQEVGKIVPNPFGGWTVSAAALQSKHDVLLGWMRASIRALKFMSEHPQETAAIAAKAYQLDPQIAQLAVPPVIQAIDPKDFGGFTDKGIQLEIENNKTALKGDYKTTDLGQLVDLSLLHQAQKDVGVPCQGGYGC